MCLRTRLKNEGKQNCARADALQRSRVEVIAELRKTTFMCG